MLPMNFWVVVSNIFSIFTPMWGRWTHFDYCNIFQRAGNHQPELGSKCSWPQNDCFRGCTKSHDHDVVLCFWGEMPLCDFWLIFRLENHQFRNDGCGNVVNHGAPTTSVQLAIRFVSQTLNGHDYISSKLSFMCVSPELLSFVGESTTPYWCICLHEWFIFVFVKYIGNYTSPIICAPGRQ